LVTSYIVFRVFVVGDDGDDGVVDEEAEGQHAAQAAEGRLVHRNVFRGGDVVKVHVDAPDGRVVTDDADLATSLTTLFFSVAVADVAAK
jgi:hypothetical protein